MIVDAHTHFWFRGYMPEAFHRNTAEEWAKKAEGRKPEMIMPKLEAGVTDPDAKAYLKHMDNAGVDASIIMMTDFGEYWSGEEPAVPYEEQVLQFSHKHRLNKSRYLGNAFVLENQAFKLMLNMIGLVELLVVSAVRSQNWDSLQGGSVIRREFGS